MDDAEEIALGTDPADPDSDGDGVDDGDEVDTHLTDPLVQDSDADGRVDVNDLMNVILDWGIDAFTPSDVTGPIPGIEEITFEGEFKHFGDPIAIELRSDERWQALYADLLDARGDSGVLLAQARVIAATSSE